MTISEQLAALRRGVVWNRATHVVPIRVTGDHAFELLDRAFSRELYVQDGQLLHGLFLDAEGRSLADVYVGRDEEELFVLAEGLEPAALVAHLESCRSPEFPDATVYSGGERLLGLHGPFAWELLAELFGPEVIGLPYLTFFREGEITCHRVGQTGEFGYLLSGPEGALTEAEARLVDLGRTFEAERADLATLDRAAFESFFFCIRDRGLAALSPRELQLQWRLGGEGYLGAEAVAGVPTHRVMMARLDGSAEPGSEVTLFGEPVGTIVSRAETPTLGGHHAYVRLRRECAHAGIGAFRAGEAALTTVTAPPLRQRSLFVNPQRHTFLARDELRFPALVPERVEEAP